MANQTSIQLINELKEIMLNTPTWFQALFWFSFILVVGSFVIKLVHSYLKKLALKTKTKYDDIFVNEITKELFIIVILFSIKFTFSKFGINSDIYHNIINTLIYIFLAIVTIKFFDFLLLIWKEKFSKRLTYKEKDKIEKALLPLLNKILKAVIWIIFIIIGLADWNINITPILGGLGLAGLALSLAAKDTLENIFAGIFLAMDKSFKIDDIVDFPDFGISGRVYDIGLRSTKIKSWDNELYIVPNSKVANAVIKNNMYPDLKGRVVIDFLVGYGSDVDKVKKIVKNVIKKIDHVIDDPEPQVILVEMADFGLKFQAKFWVDSVENRYTAKITAIEKIYKTLMKNKINIPYPTYEVLMKKK